MAAGANIGSAIGGFGRGLASALIMNRERSDQKKREERERADRAFQYQLPVLIKLGEDTGDWSALENAFATAFPDQAKSWKKDNFSMASIAPLLQSPGAMRGQPAQAGTTSEVPTGITQPPGMPVQPDILQSRAAVAPATPVQRKTLFGVELPTDEERATRAVNIESATNQARMSARRKYYDQLIAQGIPSAQAWQMAGLPEAPRPIAVGPNETLLDPTTFKPVAQGVRSTTGAGTGTELDREIARREQELGRPMTAAERLELRRQIATAERAPSATGAGDQKSLAQMAAENPGVLQGLTPTVTGAVMAEIAKDPQLRAQFNATRMEPIRAQAETMLGALEALVVVDQQGNVVGLTPGARQLFGEFTPSQVRGVIPTAAAADANAALQQVIGQQIVDLIAEMKTQSRSGATGFGQLNLRELDVLTSASTQLKQRLTEEAALAQLKNLYEKFQKITVPGADEQAVNIRTAPGAGGAGAGAGQQSVPGAIMRDGKLFINGVEIGAP